MDNSKNKDTDKSFRFKHFFISLALYLAGSFAVVFFSLQGYIRIGRNALIVSLSGVLLTNILFYGAFRSGFSRRFKDPFLTVPQIALATFWAMVVAYYAEQARSIVLLIVMLIFLLGSFRLKIRQLLFLSLFSASGYGTVVFLVYRLRPQSFNGVIDILSIIAFAAVLPWFSLVGGYITSLRNKMDKALSTIEKLVIIDDLTQVANRRQVFKILDQQKALGDRGIHPFSLCMFELDHFVEVDETYENGAGDIVLKTVAGYIHKNLRDIDHIARYEDEVFLVVLTNSGSREAMVCAKRIRDRVRELTFERMPPEFRITVSVGVTKYQPVEAILDTINRANNALLRARHEGGDRVEYEGTGPSGIN